jgi:hypothetical protein
MALAAVMAVKLQFCGYGTHRRTSKGVKNPAFGTQHLQGYAERSKLRITSGAATGLRVFMMFSGFAQVEEAASTRGWDRNLIGPAGYNHGPV